MNRAERLAGKIKTMDNQYDAIKHEIETDTRIHTELLEQKTVLETKIAIIEMKLKKNNSIKNDLSEIIDETKSSYEKISEAAETLMDIIDTKYSI